MRKQILTTVFLTAIGLTTGALAAGEAGIYDVRAFGAKGDGVTKDTAAIQAAIDAAVKAGGGEVRVPAGRYVTGTVHLKSNIDFHVMGGATIVGSKDKADYNKPDFCPQNDVCPEERVDGAHLFVCVGQTNVVLRGRGTIDGSGDHFMTYGFDPSRVGKVTGVNGLGGVNGQDAILWRPAQMIWFCESEQVRLEGLRIRNAPYWSILLIGCAHVEVDGIDIRTSRRKPYIMNGDGLAIDCCRYVHVSDCEIETSDDSLTLRATGEKLLRAPRETAYVTIANCILSSHNEAFRIGVGSGPIHDCTISNIVIYDSKRGINFSSTWFPEKGCDFVNIRFDNIVANVSTSFLKIHRQKSTEPVVRGLHFSNISGTQGEPSFIWSRRGKPFENITLVNVDMNNGIEVINVNDFKIVGGTIQEIKLPPEEYEERCRDIESFTKMLW